MQLETTVTIVAASIIAFLFFLEFFIPFYKQKQPKVKHAAYNISFAIINGVVITFLFSAATLAVTQSGFANTYGIIHVLKINSPLLAIIVAILLKDFWMYWWHRASHQIPFFWRFHKMHHSDLNMDVTTGIRFHPAEMFFSFLFRIPVLAIIGMSMTQLAVYELIMFPIILLHHSNIVFPKKIDKMFRVLFASPHMHRVHHSDILKERNTNYGTIFSFWDRIFNTFIMISNQRRIVQGVKQLKTSKYHSMMGLLKTPFMK